MAFHVTADGDTLTATSNDPRLHEVEWRWTGGGVIEYGLPGHPVGVVNVYDYKLGRPRLDFTAEAFRQHLDDVYADVDQVEAVADEVAHG